MEQIYFPGSNDFIKNIFNDNKSLDRQFLNIFQNSINIIELASQIFIITTLRYYEDIILNEPEDKKKKVREIKITVKNRFTAPSLGSLLKLTNQCYHLIDETAPPKLMEMKTVLDQHITLGPIGNFIDDLEKIYQKIDETPLDTSKSRVMNRAKSKKKVLQNILPEFVRFRNDSAHLREIRTIIEDYYADLNLDIEIWRQAVQNLLEILAPIINSRYVLKSLTRIDPSKAIDIDRGKKDLRFVLTKKVYENNLIEESEEQISYEEFEESQHEISLIEFFSGDGKYSLDLFPFLFIKNDKLYYYKKTTANGYQYFSIVDGSTTSIQTKKKFNQSLFKISKPADEQEIFWTDVLPIQNQRGTIKANIPHQGDEVFVGRMKQMRRVVDEIISIPNQNGIVYGPGGIGKTALMVQLTWKLFNEEIHDKPTFNYIVWVSAKTNFYDWRRDWVKEKERQFESLDNIFTVVLCFFDFENVKEYDFEDKKELVLELFENHRILLIIDNLETVSKNEVQKIIDFFGIEVKQRLREKPDFFKVIITSRELISSGFHQIRLDGLDRRESKKLMKSLFEAYKGTQHPELTEEQMDRIHDVTCGIPIIIKHVFGQLYEFNQPFEHIMIDLASAGNEVLKFSFSEIFALLAKDEYLLRVLILLEVRKEPITFRQISDTLKIDQNLIHKKLPILLNFLCVTKINQGPDEKYVINDEVNLFAKSLVLKHNDILQEIRDQISSNLTLEKQMDYSKEEYEILKIFRELLVEKRYLEAEDFIKDQLRSHPNSIFFKYHYAKFLKEQKHAVEDALQILEACHEKLRSNDQSDLSIIRLLASCHTSLDIPNFYKAKIYYDELSHAAEKDEELSWELAEFYIKWSTTMKLRGESDPIKDIKRKVEYKKLARTGLEYLKRVISRKDTHEYYYLRAQGLFNLWENTEANQMINKAISLINQDPNYLHTYSKLRKAIHNKLR